MAPHPGHEGNNGPPPGAEAEGPTTCCLGTNTPDQRAKGLTGASLNSHHRGDSISVIECPATYTKEGVHVQSGDIRCGPWFSDSAVPCIH